MISTLTELQQELAELAKSAFGRNGSPDQITMAEAQADALVVELRGDHAPAAAALADQVACRDVHVVVVGRRRDDVADGDDRRPPESG
jgi:hypothetical protein